MSDPAKPVARTDRIGMLDMTRGIAVLGILLMNIVGLGIPEAYEDPTNWGGATGANLMAWRITSFFFEGTMRGLFTLLFGAGALLFLQRHAHAASPGLARLYYGRTFWLIVFGLLNAYVLLWEGDVLFYYGVVGLALYLFRKLPARALWLIGIAVLAVPTIVKIGDRADYVALQARAASAAAAQDSGAMLDPAQRFAVDELRWTDSSRKPPQADLEYAIMRVTQSYGSAADYLRSRTFYLETYFFSEYVVAEFFAMMLLGMAMLRMGILAGTASRRTYVAMMCCGYLLGGSVNLWEMRHLESASFSVAAMMDTGVTYDLGRVSMTFGHLGLIGLLWQSNGFGTCKRSLSAVGQMALTNYLSQSILGALIFTGAGLGLFGLLQRYELYFIVAMIWAAQLAWSPWWLKRFQFGPAEWLWRTLTYGQRPPMRAAVAQPSSVTGTH